MPTITTFLRDKPAEFLQIVAQRWKLGIPESGLETARKSLAAGMKDPELVAEVRQWMEQTSPEGIIGGLLAMRDRADYVAQLPGFKLPSLVLGAELDMAVPVDHACVLAAGLPDASLEIIQGAGHMVNLEKPDTFNQALLAYLAKLRSK